ncbi:pimeloyl-ACP methyl ester carboxylesterase [Paraperlucidibaca baekdonensis]|uniref:Pimeloyl-ACP methyl ester carboxylesterase n=1 Tax=Paraperlucidibaca baekdonensis TaxID=748120 RepID=A0A3E0H841_9GAMM|nr:alpha/beta fold hydrolase [Paraperlucidibaca baekdonensis]REH39908.1 pimeloyl-ACP methyl ester carboxylesterase [Paraperlucidibaca baekdonensis]
MKTYRIRTTDGINLHAMSLGSADAPALVLVHGYPDNHRVWIPVAERLAEHFQVILYDVRGAGDSDCGRNVAAYRLTQLARDLEAVVDAIIPGQQFHLAAHDWGSIQSWQSVTGEALKDFILSFSSISGPSLDHAGHWMRKRLGSGEAASIKEGLKQLSSSWYIMLFQLPVLAPSAWKLGVGRWWPRYLSRYERVQEAQPNPCQIADGAEGVKLYRANFMNKLAGPAEAYANCPVQIIVPARDKFVNVALFDDLKAWVPELYRRDIDGGHWVLLSQPDLVAQWLREFTQGISKTRRPLALQALAVEG